MDAHTTSSVMIIKIIVTPPRANGAREKCVWVEKPELFMKCVRERAARRRRAAAYL